MSTVIPKPFAKGYEELVFNWEISIVEDDGVENLDRGTQHHIIIFGAEEGHQLVARARWNVGQTWVPQQVMIEQGEHKVYVHQDQHDVHSLESTPTVESPPDFKLNRPQDDEDDDNATFCLIL